MGAAPFPHPLTCLLLYYLWVQHPLSHPLTYLLLQYLWVQHPSLSQTYCCTICGYSTLSPPFHILAVVVSARTAHPSQPSHIPAAVLSVGTAPFPTLSHTRCCSICGYSTPPNTLTYPLLYYLWVQHPSQRSHIPAAVLSVGTAPPPNPLTYLLLYYLWVQHSSQPSHIPAAVLSVGTAPLPTLSHTCCSTICGYSTPPNPLTYLLL